jgi:HlyD family secretion protein
MMSRLVTGPRLLLAMLLVAAAIAIVVATRTPPVPVEVGAVVRGPLAVTIDELGETRVSDLYVVSTPTAGRVTRVNLKPGAPVLPNVTILARVQPIQPEPIDARNLARSRAEVEALQAQLSAATARIRELRAEQLLAERELERTSALVRRKFVSRSTLDRAQSARDRARAATLEAVRTADATAHSLDAARANLLVPGSVAGGRGSVPVTSPVPGVLLRVPQESERVVPAGTPLAEVGDPDRLELVTDLLSADAVRVEVGDSVLIEEWGGDRPLLGRVRLVEPFGFTKISALGVEEQRVNVVIDFIAPRDAWRRLGHGYRATVRIIIDQAGRVLKIPISALFRAAGKWSVYVMDSDGRARLRSVQIGRMNDDEAEVLTGLAERQKIILHPSDKVEDGIRVEPRD